MCPCPQGTPFGIVSLFKAYLYLNIGHNQYAWPSVISFSSQDIKDPSARTSGLLRQTKKKSHVAAIIVTICHCFSKDTRKGMCILK